MEKNLLVSLEHQMKPSTFYVIRFLAIRQSKDFFHKKAISVVLLHFCECNDDKQWALFCSHSSDSWFKLDLMKVDKTKYKSKLT